MRGVIVTRITLGSRPGLAAIAKRSRSCRPAVLGKREAVCPSGPMPSRFSRRRRTPRSASSYSVAAASGSASPRIRWTCGPTVSSSSSVRFVAAAFDRVCDAIRASMEETQTPGVAVGMLHQGEEEVAGFGVTSIENPLEVTPDTLFQIGSITKTFTGTVAMRLVERGELDLDAALRTYLPHLKLSDADVAARVTMRHLLTHTGGWIGDYFDDVGPGEDALARVCSSMSELPQLTPLGDVWSY